MNSDAKIFRLQWHLTARCSQNCRHCYVKNNESYKKELENELSFMGCKRIIDDFSIFCRELGATPYVSFTGGDPLIREDFFKILDYAKEKSFRISVLGNPYLINKIIIEKLKKYDLDTYQVSLDGLRITHDSLRSKGSFATTIKAIKLLIRSNINVSVMFTLSKKNFKQLIPVMRLVSKLGVNSFAFARVCSKDRLQELDFTPFEYRNFLAKIYSEEKALLSKGSKTVFVKKDHLWLPFLSEIGIIKFPLSKKDVIIGGCSIGCNTMSILADGTVFACRRLFSPIGKVPEESLMDVFLSNKTDYYRNTLSIACQSCELFSYCRGCPAVGFWKTQIYGSNDPHCWRITTSY
jgi:radical SAM/SPASM domain protein of ACGX system